MKKNTKKKPTVKAKKYETDGRKIVKKPITDRPGDILLESIESSANKAHELFDKYSSELNESGITDSSSLRAKRIRAQTRLNIAAGIYSRCIAQEMQEAKRNNQRYGYNIHPAFRDELASSSVHAAEELIKANELYDNEGSINPRQQSAAYQTKPWEPK